MEERKHSMPGSRAVLPLALAATVAACSSSRQTLPDRTATEQLLISTAVDRAANSMVMGIPDGKKVYADTQNFEGYDSKYAIGAIRDSLLKQGLHLTDEKENAEIVLELRAGVISIDKTEDMLGIPSIEIPLPGQIETPEIALFKKHEQKGVVKIAATAYDAKTGALIDSSGPRYGYSHKTSWVYLLFFTRTTDDLKTEDDPWWEW
jgi:hypothetical protein